MLAFSTRVAVLALGAVITVGLNGPATAQHTPSHHAGQEKQQPATAPTTDSTVLQAPGQSVFGAVQEAIRHLEADSTTDWSQVNVDRLRQHLLDMHHVAVHVAVEEQTPIENGLRLRVRPTREAARASLDRVLDAHPHMLKRETGWTMAVDDRENAYVLRVTTSDADDIAKIRALGYMGLLAYGQHHQRHHWHLVKGKHPHRHGSQ